MSLHLEGKVDLCWGSRHLSANGIGALFIQLEDQNILKHIYKKEEESYLQGSTPKGKVSFTRQSLIELKGAATSQTDVR